MVCKQYRVDTDIVEAFIEVCTYANVRKIKTINDVQMYPEVHVIRRSQRPSHYHAILILPFLSLSFFLFFLSFSFFLYFSFFLVILFPYFFFFPFFFFELIFLSVSLLLKILTIHIVTPSICLSRVLPTIPSGCIHWVFLWLLTVSVTDSVQGLKDKRWFKYMSTCINFLTRASISFLYIPKFVGIFLLNNKWCFC